MKKEAQYNNFKESIADKINKAIDTIHLSIANKHYIFSFLKQYECEIRKAGIDYDKIKEFDRNDYNGSFYVNRDCKISEDEILNTIIHSNLNTFIYLSYSKIDTLLEYIEYMTYIYNIPYTVYSYLIKQFNKKIIETVIEGDAYSFGFGLSRIFIKRGERSSKKKAVNWGISNKIRREQLHTTGEEEGWISYHESRYYYFFFWKKGNCTISNNDFYNFKVTSFNNKPDRKINNYYDTVAHMKQVIEDEGIGNLEKLNACIKLHPELANEYLNN